MAAGKSAGSRAAALARSPTQLLQRAQQLAADIYAEELGPGAITHRQFAVLTAVAADEGVAQSVVTRVTGIDRSTLAELLDRMATKGLLVREPSPSDRRANALRLTAAGRVALEEAAPKVARADARLLKLLGAAGRRKELMGQLSDLVAAGEPEPRAGGRWAYRNMTVGQRLQKAREAAGLSVSALAAKVGRSAPTISRHETGQIAVRNSQAAQYAAALNVAPDWLLFGTGNRPAPLRNA